MKLTNKSLGSTDGGNQDPIPLVNKTKVHACGSFTTISWVKYNGREVLVTVLGLSLRAEVAHRRLCDLVWSTGRWPEAQCDATAKLARVSPSAWPAVLAELRSVGWHPQGAQLTNADVARTRREAERFRASAAARGRRGGHASGTTRRRRASEAQLQLSSSAAEAEPKPVQGKDSTVQDTDIAINRAERLTFSPSAPKKSSGNAEKRYLEEVTEAIASLSPALASAELAEWGGWWRNRYRQNSNKAKRILAEIRCMIRERRVLSNPGAAAVDLWKRLP